MIPDTAVQRSQRGIVEAIGPQVKAIHMNDIIVLPKNAGVPFKEEERLYLVKETEVLYVES